MIGRVALVLRVLGSSEPNGARTSEVARQAGVARPTAHRLLTSLASRGLVDRSPQDGRWVLGPELYLLGAAAARRFDVTALAQPFVRRLAQQTQESAFFSVRRGEETVCLVREEGSFPLRSHVLYEGVRFPLGVASAGLAILAFLPSDEVEAALSSPGLEAFGHAHAAALLIPRLERARKLGYAVNPGLIVEGSWGMAAAVFDTARVPVAALSLTGVEHRFGESRRADLGRQLLDATHELSLRLQAGAPK